MSYIRNGWKSPFPSILNWLVVSGFQDGILCNFGSSGWLRISSYLLSRPQKKKVLTFPTCSCLLGFPSPPKKVYGIVQPFSRLVFEASIENFHFLLLLLLLVGMKSLMILSHNKDLSAYVLRRCLRFEPTKL